MSFSRGGGGRGGGYGGGGGVRSGQGGGGHGGGPRGGASRGPTIEVLFDPTRSDAELFDALAEQQADSLGAVGNINSNQLRKFFGEIKDLYRRFETLVAGRDESEHAAIYESKIAPLFKMVRSKVAYASRKGGQATMPEHYADFLSGGIAKVNDQKQFRRYVLHLEAVVGFLYGKGLVSK